jgi:hypothetical protein
MMRNTSAANNQRIGTVILLSLTLLLGFTAGPALRYSQERQTVPTELVSRNSKQHQTVAYSIPKNNFPLYFFISCREIITRLALFDVTVSTKRAENLKSLMVAKRLTIEFLHLTAGRSQLAEAYFKRG